MYEKEDEETYQEWEDAQRLNPKWECVESSFTDTSQGRMHVSTWRLAVPGGWLYKVTERDQAEHYTVQVCFVPKVTN